MKIVAMVRFNNDWAYVFDEPICLKYREETHDGQLYLIGQSGPFYDFLKFQRASGRFKAFAGRKFTLNMEDGTQRVIQDDWWSCGSPIGPLTHITHSSIKSLKKCYVYAGGNCNQEALQTMVDEYDNRTSEPYGHRTGGYRYDYYDYKKVIEFDDLRSKQLREQRYFEKTKSHLVQKVKDLSKLVRVNTTSKPIGDA